MSSIELDSKHGGSIETELIPEASKSEPESARPPSIQGEPCDPKAKNSNPRAYNHTKETDATEHRRVRTLLARSFRALGLSIRFSMISRSFKGTSNMHSDQNTAATDQKGDQRDSEWADVVDNVVESDNENESFDSYIEFMGHHNVGRGDTTLGGKFVWFTKRKLDQPREEEAAEDGEYKDGTLDEDMSESEPSVPWFESDFGSEP